MKTPLTMGKKVSKNDPYEKFRKRVAPHYSDRTSTDFLNKDFKKTLQKNVKF